MCVVWEISHQELKEEGWTKKKIKKTHSVTFVKSGARVDWLDSLLKSGNEVVVLYHAGATQMLFEAVKV